ncbi:hypothetical protein CHS0354_024533 [Potamilus streckersoni]|uniref:Uncharacterized protein n=1 Tax=Potamilus streckersoni TaxID=2493646 RepID=A0AAE0TL91_9BIVA|nr:hypothetical protein CHS0354_024533 [Potamilus streckersoni]
MDDFGSSSGGFSSSDAAGFTTDAGGCSAFTSSDTGGISSSCGGVSDSGPFMTSNWDSGLGVSDHVQCNFTGDNAYYDACFQNSMQNENVRAYPNHLQMDSSQSTHPILVMPSAPYSSTATYGFVDGRFNMGGHVNCYEKNSTCNQTKAREMMLLRSEIAQLQIILASSKADENKKAAIRAKISDLTARMEGKGNMTGQCNIGLGNYQNHVTAVTRHKQPAAFHLHPTSAGVDMQDMQKFQSNSCILGIIMVVIMCTIIAVTIGVVFTIGSK